MRNNQSWVKVLAGLALLVSFVSIILSIQVDDGTFIIDQEREHVTNRPPNNHFLRNITKNVHNNNQDDERWNNKVSKEDSTVTTIQTFDDKVDNEMNIQVRSTKKKFSNDTSTV